MTPPMTIGTCKNTQQYVYEEIVQSLIEMHVVVLLIWSNNLQNLSFRQDFRFQALSWHRRPVHKQPSVEGHRVSALKIAECLNFGVGARRLIASHFIKKAFSQSSNALL